MELFFELLQVALGTRDSLSRIPSEHDWDAMFEEAQRQAIEGVLAEGINHLPKECQPPEESLWDWVALSLRGEANTRQNMKRTRELVSLAQTAGFRGCVLKGVAMARYYPEPLRRQCGDIDFWIFGRRKNVMAWLRSRYKILHNVWHNVGVEVFEDVPVEIHFHPGWVYNPFFNWRLQRWFNAYGLQFSATEPLEHGFVGPTADFDAVFSLMHSFRHLLVQGVGLRHVVDYFYILRSDVRDKKEDVMKLLHSFGMEKFAGAMMWVLSSVCGMPTEELLCKPNEKEGRFLLKEIMQGGNFGNSRTDGMGYNSLRRYWVTMRHFPSEVLWMLPWKLWHRFWCMFDRN